MFEKGQCLNCEYCTTKDDGFERQLCCTKTKRGRKITWTMHTAHRGQDGKFIPDSIEALDKRLEIALMDKIPPAWCPFRKLID